MPEPISPVFTFNTTNAHIPQAVAEETDEENNSKGRILHTIGIELESIGLSKDTAGRILMNLPNGIGNNFKVVHDASTEMYVFYVPTGDRNNKFLIINRHTKDARTLFEDIMHTGTHGYELVSSPLKREELELALWTLLPKLENTGDFLSDRCATHIHIGMERKISTLRKLLRLGLWADELFYSLAGMGGKFRGWSNNAIYARPLINGPYINIVGNYYQILNWKKALEAKNMDEFFSAYAINPRREATKYHPARYFAINIYSVLLHKTVEFRHFNQSFDPALVSAVAKLCQLFAEIGIKADEESLKNLDVGNVFETRRPSHYLNILYKLVDMGNELECQYKISNSDIRILENVIYTYSGIGIEDVPVFTHVKDINYDTGAIVMGELITTKTKPIFDGHIDIHNIKDSSIMRK